MRRTAKATPATTPRSPAILKHISALRSCDLFAISIDHRAGVALSHLAGRSHHFQDQLIKRDFGRGSCAAESVTAAIALDGNLKVLENLAVLAQIFFGHRNFLRRFGFDIKELDVAEQIRFGLALVVDLDDMWLVAAVAQDVQ